MNLKELRQSKQLTQAEASRLVEMPLRTYKNYENDQKKVSSIKYLYLMEKLSKYNVIDETHGILTLKQIKEKVEIVFSQYDIKFCYLFGSYARGNPTPTSDIDLFISSDITGIKLFGLAERLREELHKRVDLLHIDQIENNRDLLEEILLGGIRIYGGSKE